jgi:hypothetical protein
LQMLAGGFASICNSAPAPSQATLVNTDIAGFPAADITSGFFYSSDDQASWTEGPLLVIGTPGYESTWQGSFPTPGSGTVWYYVQADSAQFRMTQSPRNSDDAWPPPDNLVAWAAVEPAGDAFNNPEGPWLDLTGVWLGYSDEYFYFRLTNNHDSWPTSGGLLKWYAYSVGFANPEAPSDTWILAPVYVDAWPVMQFGLYAINRYTGATPEKLGDIDYQTSGNRLDMRCRIADMTGDRRFGPWPNSPGWLASAANAQTITVSGSTLKDTTATCVYYGGRTQSKLVGRNTSPQVSMSGVYPDSGTGQTAFLFSVRYADADTNLPVIRCLLVDGDTSELVPSGHGYWGGVIFRATLVGFEPGWHRFSFRFDDGMSAVATPDDSFFVYGLGVGKPDAVRPRIDGPNFARGTLRLPHGTVELLAADGRKVLDLRPGPNDVSRLSPGIYFVRERSAVSGKRSADSVRKVVITK